MLKTILFVSLMVVIANATSIPKLEQKIVGGKDANIEDYPYQVSVRYYGQHICGGSIISSTRILTAAHCIKGFHLTGFTIRVGSSFSHMFGQIYKVNDTMVDGLFNPETYNYDLAVLFLARELVFTKKVQQIPTATKEPPENASAVVTGWGAVAENQGGTHMLQVVTVPIVGRKRCNKYYEGQITPLMICAGYTNGGKDSCQGDSGGPLVSNGVLVGIVSWGYGCARPHYPGVYTNVAKLVH